MRSSRQLVRFYMLAGVALWVVRSEDGGQLISCHTRTHILDFCEIIFGFPSHSLYPAFGPECSLGPKTQEKHVKISKIVLHKPMRMCNNTQRANSCFLLFHPLCFSCRTDRVDLSVIYSEMTVGKEFIVLSK